MLYGSTMRYQEVCDRFQTFASARAEAAREWKLSNSVVMLAEFDVFAASRASLAIPIHSELNAGRVPRLLRVAFFDTSPGNLRVEIGSLTPPELVQAAEYQATLNDWVAGRIAELPPSTSRLLDAPRR